MKGNDGKLWIAIEKGLFKNLLAVSKFSTSAPGVRRVCAGAPGPCAGIAPVAAPVLRVPAPAKNDPVQ